MFENESAENKREEKIMEAEDENKKERRI